jgi:hypothetical protein
LASNYFKNINDFSYGENYACQNCGNGLSVSPTFNANSANRWNPSNAPSKSHSRVKCSVNGKELNVIGFQGTNFGGSINTLLLDVVHDAFGLIDNFASPYAEAQKVGNNFHSDGIRYDICTGHS